ncbi:MAG: NAD-glutamate dehydrogenase, partial [Pseudolabrys sp.]
MTDNLAGADESRAARSFISQAAPQARDVPVDFTTTLFGRAAPEDLLRYQPQELAQFAQQAWSFLAQRQIGRATVKFDEMLLPASASGEPRAVGVIEIVNDDMPFLVDSVMAELAAQGLSVRLVAHPMFTVERDSSGKLTAFRGAAAVNGAARESFIHIHVDPVAD